LYITHCIFISWQHGIDRAATKAYYKSLAITSTNSDYCRGLSPTDHKEGPADIEWTQLAE